MGELKSKVRYAIHRYLNDELTDEGFKAQIIEIIREFENRLNEKILYQDIGLIAQERERGIPSKSVKFRRIWALLDQLEPRIKGNLNNWIEKTRK